MRCSTHDLAVASDGLCIVCRRDAERVPHVAPPPARRGGSGGTVAVACAFVGLAVFGALRAFSPVAAAEKAHVRAANGAGTVGAPQVTIYSTSWCGSCKAAKAWLRKNDIAFEDLDIERNASARERYQALSRRNVVPVLQIGEVVLEGFDPGAVRRALDGG